MPRADDRSAGCQQTFACGEQDGRLSLRDRQARPFSLRQDTAGHHASGGDLYIRKPPSLRKVRDPLPERGIEIDCQTVRFGCNPRTPPRKRTPGPAPARFLRWFSGSCGWGGSLGSEPDVSQIPQASPNVLTDPGPDRRPYHPSVNPGGVPSSDPSPHPDAWSFPRRARQLTGPHPSRRECPPGCPTDQAMACQAAKLRKRRATGTACASKSAISRAVTGSIMVVGLRTKAVRITPRRTRSCLCSA